MPVVNAVRDGCGRVVQHAGCAREALLFRGKGRDVGDLKLVREPEFIKCPKI
jgi:hypothetical protein